MGWEGLLAQAAEDWVEAHPEELTPSMLGSMFIRYAEDALFAARDRARTLRS